MLPISQVFTYLGAFGKKTVYLDYKEEGFFFKQVLKHAEVDTPGENIAILDMTRAMGIKILKKQFKGSGIVPETTPGTAE